MLAKKMLDALTYRGNWFVDGLMMGRASYYHSVAYDLRRLDALKGAIEICWEYWRNPRG